MPTKVISWLNNPIRQNLQSKRVRQASKRNKNFKQQKQSNRNIINGTITEKVDKFTRPPI